MDFKQLQEEFRKLEQDAGEKTAGALIAIMELRSSEFIAKLQDFKNDVDRRFESQEKSETLTRWLMGIGFTAIALIIALSNFLKLGA